MSLRCAPLFLCALLALSVAPAPAAEQLPIGASSGLPVPRFVSLKADRVNVRGGPTKDHEVAWIFTRAGLPVEVVAEFDNWRRIRDSEGAEGWVYHSLLSGRRMAVVEPNQKKTTSYALHTAADAASGIAAKLEPGVLAQVKKCTGTWCRISGSGFDGWIEQYRLWGVYPNEKID